MWTKQHLCCLVCMVTCGYLKACDFVLGCLWLSEDLWFCIGSAVVTWGSVILFGVACGCLWACGCLLACGFVLGCLWLSVGLSFCIESLVIICGLVVLYWDTCGVLWACDLILGHLCTCVFVLGCLWWSVGLWFCIGCVKSHFLFYLHTYISMGVAYT